MRSFVFPLMLVLFGTATAHAAPTGPRNPFLSPPCQLSPDETGCIEASLPRLYLPRR